MYGIWYCEKHDVHQHVFFPCWYCEAERKALPKHEQPADVPGGWD